MHGENALDSHMLVHTGLLKTEKGKKACIPNPPGGDDTRHSVTEQPNPHNSNSIFPPLTKFFAD